MKIVPFSTEQFFAQYEFTTPFQLCNSDCETITIKELLMMADIPLEQLGHLSLGYTESLGNPDLRKMIGDTYTNTGFDDVVMIGSPIEGIYLTDRAVLHPGDEVVILSGLSKTYGLPGLRTGWLIIKDNDLRKNIINWKFYTSICPPAPSEFLAMAAWKIRDKLRKRSISQIEQNLKMADAFFSRWPDLFSWRKPIAGSTALIGINVPSVTEYAVKLADKAGILILPGLCLGSDDKHFRMGFGRSAFSRALEKFEEYLES